MRPVIVVGDIVTDTLAVHDRPLAVGSDIAARICVTGGGSAANTAAWLAWLGVPVTLVGVVGTDPAGTARLAELEEAGVRLAVRRTHEWVTGSVVVLATADERTMLVDRGANGALTADDILPALAEAGHLHLSGYTLLDPGTRAAGRAALAAARAHGATASVDAASAAPLRSVGRVSFFQWIRAASLLFANAEEARALAGDAGGTPEQLARCLVAELEDAFLGGVRGSSPAGPSGGSERPPGAQQPAAVLKLGAGGAMWVRRGQVHAVPAQPAVAVDPTGAGDAFAAGVLAAWLRGSDPPTALAAGATVAARAVSAPGGRP